MHTPCHAWRCWSFHSLQLWRGRTRPLKVLLFSRRPRTPVIFKVAHGSWEGFQGGRVEIWWSNKEPESTLCWGVFSEKIGVFRKLRLMCVWCACNCSKVSTTFVRDQRSMMWFCKRVWIRVGNLPDIHQHWQRKRKSHASSLHSVFFEKNSPYFVCRGFCSSAFTWVKEMTWIKQRLTPKGVEVTSDQVILHAQQHVLFFVWVKPWNYFCLRYVSFFCIQHFEVSGRQFFQETTLPCQWFLSLKIPFVWWNLFLFAFAQFFWIIHVYYDLSDPWWTWRGAGWCFSLFWGEDPPRSPKQHAGHWLHQNRSISQHWARLRSVHQMERGI